MVRIISIRVTVISIGDNLFDVIAMPHVIIADQFEIKADVPGVSKQDINLNVDADVLSISVDKVQKKVSLLPPFPSCKLSSRHLPDK